MKTPALLLLAIGPAAFAGGPESDPFFTRDAGSAVPPLARAAVPVTAPVLRVPVPEPVVPRMVTIDYDVHISRYANREFAVAIRNTSTHPVDLTKDWRAHTLLIDGEPRRLASMGWWCGWDSPPRLAANGVYARSMHFSSYTGGSLAPGEHSMELEIGGIRSNPLKFTVAGP